MAGITDYPFRKLCREMGAGLAVSEMVTSDTRLWQSKKSTFRLPHLNEDEPRSVQIAGADPEQMANAARANVALGAQIIDINMGCPAKKVCHKLAGSALMRDEQLVANILRTVVQAVDVPVTLKIRTGWDHEHKNAINIAKIAEFCGIKAVSIHGRTRVDLYKGDAEYDTIASVKQAVEIPVFANGDIDTPEKAKHVLDYTQVDGLLIGRASQGNPWIFRQIDTYLKTGVTCQDPTIIEKKNIILRHLKELHLLYGESMGVRIARKHVGWYLAQLPKNTELKLQFNQLQSAQQQMSCLTNFFLTYALS